MKNTSVSSKEKSQDQENSQIQVVSILQNKEPGKRNQKDITIIKNGLQQIEFFKRLEENKGEESLKLSAMCLQFEQFDQNINVITHGEKGDKFYIILFGVLEVHVPNTAGEFMKVSLLVSGQSFGELALLNDAPRRATIKTAERSGLAVLSKKNYLKIIADMEEIEIRKKIEFLQSVSLFRPINTRSFNEYIFYFKSKSFKWKEVVYNIGENPKYVYVIKAGEFIIQTLNKSPFKSIDFQQDFQQESRVDHACQLAILGPNEIFGEVDCLLSQKRKFQAICNSQTAEVWAITKKHFLGRVMDNYSVRKKKYLENYLENKVGWDNQRISAIYQTLNIIDRSLSPPAHNSFSSSQFKQESAEKDSKFTSLSPTHFSRGGQISFQNYIKDVWGGSKSQGLDPLIRPLRKIQSPKNSNNDQKEILPGTSNIKSQSDDKQNKLTIERREQRPYSSIQKYKEISPINIKCKTISNSETSADKKKIFLNTSSPFNLANIEQSSQEKPTQVRESINTLTSTLEVKNGIKQLEIKKISNFLEEEDADQKPQKIKEAIELLPNKSPSIEQLQKEFLDVDIPARNKFPKIRNKSCFLNNESIELDKKKKLKDCILKTDNAEDRISKLNKIKIDICKAHNIDVSLEGVKENGQFFEIEIPKYVTLKFKTSSNESPKRRSHTCRPNKLCAIKDIFLKIKHIDTLQSKYNWMSSELPARTLQPFETFTPKLKGQVFQQNPSTISISQSDYSQPLIITSQLQSPLRTKKEKGVIELSRSLFSSKYETSLTTSLFLKRGHPPFKKMTPLKDENDYQIFSQL